MVTRLRLAFIPSSRLVLAALTLFGLILGACEPDENKITVSFVESFGADIPEDAYPEIVGHHGPALMLDVPWTEDVSVTLTESGEAQFGIDYTFHNPVVIRKGTTVAPIGLRFIDDSYDEINERVDLVITAVDNKKVRIGSNSNYFTIRDDDVSSLRVSLFWTVGDFAQGGYNDMDLYLWKEKTPGSNIFEKVKSSANHDYQGSSEHIRLESLEGDGRYGLSFVLYHYTSVHNNPFPFTVKMETIGEMGFEQQEYPIMNFEVVYQKANLNKGDATIIEQYFTKEGHKIKNITQVIVPSQGS